MSRSLESQHQIADALWEAMWIDRYSPDDGNRLLRWYRRAVYERLVGASTRRVRAHKSPEPFLSMRASVELLSGQGWHRQDERFEGIVGGAATEVEYQDLVAGGVAKPLLLVAGYPRSGTTSLQTVIRWSFPSHICEVETEEDRFSLWEYPKHSSPTMSRILSVKSGSYVVFLAFRSFVDCAASLVIGRGSTDQVNLKDEQEKWESWIPLLDSAGCVPVSFASISKRTPKQLGEALSSHIGVTQERHIDEHFGYGDLMLSLGKGVVDDKRQSNVPQESRKSLLAEARAWVIGQLGTHEADRLADLHAYGESLMVPFGTEDPA